LAIKGHVAVLILDRPAKLNALTGEMTAELAGHVAAINASDAVRAVVLTGRAGRSARALQRDGDAAHRRSRRHATALRWGLVSEIVPLDGLSARALELASVIANRAPVAAQTAKLNLRAGTSAPRPGCSSTTCCRRSLGWWWSG